MHWSTRVGVIAFVALSQGCMGVGEELDASDGSGGESAGTSGISGGTSAGSGSIQICEGEDGWDEESDGSYGGGSSDDTPVGMDDDMPLVVAIPGIQQGEVPPDTRVELQDVVIISPRVPSDVGGSFEQFVQDPAGGPWSGLRLRITNGVPSLAVGEGVDVVGRVIERDGFYALTVTQMVPLGPGQLPPPAVVSVDQLHIDDEDGRAYEGIPIRVEQVVVTDDDPCDGEFVLEDIVRVDDRFAPQQLPSPSTGTMLSFVEGVLIYAEDALEIGPRSADEVQ